VLENISLHHKRYIFIALRNTKLEKLEERRYEIYNRDSDVALKEPDVDYIFWTFV